MPFAGASPRLTDKIDRCVNEVMARGRSKSSAIAICRSSIERKKANFGARRGERITGRLFRGEGGQFTSGGNGGEDKPVSRRDRLALTQLRNGVRLKPARMAELQKAGFVTSAGKLTPKGLKAIGKKKPTTTAGGKKKPKKGGGGGKGDKKRQAVQKQVDTLNDAEKRLFRLFASGDLDKLPASLATKLERLGFVSKAGKMTATGRIAFDILGKDKKKAHTTKDKQDAIEQANYRFIGEKSTQICTTCRFNDAGTCTLFDFKFDRDHICDRWRPNIKALRERARVLRGEEQRRQVPTGKALREMDRAQLWETLKRSRSASEQRAMFAKMGASGSLGGKVGGKRVAGLNKTQQRKISAMMRRGKKNGWQKVEIYARENVPNSYIVLFRGKANASGRIDQTRKTGLAIFSDGSTSTGFSNLPGAKGKPLSSASLKQATAHGPGGLLSPAGLSKGTPNAMILPNERKRKADKPMKKEADGLHPASHYLFVPDPSKPSTWKLRYRNIKGEVDPRLLGAAHAALTVGFRGRKVQVPASDKAKLLARVNKLRGKKSKSTFKVFKDAQGKPRWVAISSNSFRDKDGEIVSQKALENAVAKADTTKERGGLRWWHVPIELGKADFQMVHGKMLVESGTFKSDAIAHKVAQNAGNLEISIGFRHPPTEPDRDGVFHNISIFERSLVPKGRAANPFTSLQVKGGNMPNDAKLQALKTLLGEEATDLLNGAELTEKSALEAGIAYKSHDELSQLTADELLDYALTLKEAEEAESEEMAEEEAGEDSPLTMTELKAAMADFRQDLRNDLKEFMGTRKEVTIDTSAVDAVSSRVSDLEAQLLEAKKELAVLQDEQPRALKSGYRATRDAETVKDEQAIPQVTTEKTADQVYADFGAQLMNPVWERGGI